mgnify:CR=1 FL=1
MQSVRTDVAALVDDDPRKHAFRVHRDAYVDQGVFELEIDRFFHHGWVYAAHESQLPAAASFVSTTLGRQPVLITRGSDGQLRGFFNRCRHRGAVVCKERQGQSDNFRCPYHGWSFKGDGSLAGLPGPDGYGADFPRAEMGLVPVAELASYRGFIFVSLARPDVDLQTHLGQARVFLDRLCDQRPQGLSVVPGTTRYGFDANWKLQIENALDFYHLPVVHRSFFEIKRARGESGKMTVRDFATDQCVALERGHGTVLASDANGHVNQNLFNFPNLVILENPAPQLRVIFPQRVDRTEIEGLAFFSADAGEAERSRLLGLYERFYGPMGFGTPDDIEIFRACMNGFMAEAAPWNDFSRGYHRELDHLPNGDAAAVMACGNITDETFVRGLYRWWMNALRDVRA